MKNRFKLAQSCKIIGKKLCSWAFFFFIATDMYGQSNFCDKKEYPKLSLDSVRRNICSIVKSKSDTCVTNLIAFLGDQYIASGKGTYMTILDSVCVYSDASISDYITSEGTRIVSKRFQDFFLYAFKNKNNKKSRSSWLLTESITQYIEDYENGKASLAKEINSMLAMSKYTLSQKEYIKVIARGNNIKLD